MLIFGVVLIVGVAYAGSSLLHDLSFVHSDSILPYLLLGLALLVELGFRKGTTGPNQYGPDPLAPGSLPPQT